MCPRWHRGLAATNSCQPGQASASLRMRASTKPRRPDSPALEKIVHSDGRGIADLAASCHARGRGPCHAIHVAEHAARQRPCHAAHAVPVVADDDDNTAIALAVAAIFVLIIVATVAAMLDLGTGRAAYERAPTLPALPPPRGGSGHHGRAHLIQPSNAHWPKAPLNLRPLPPSNSVSPGNAHWSKAPLHFRP